MDAHRLDPVDFADGKHQLALARQSQAFAFKRARGAEGDRIEHLACPFGRGDPGVARNQHPRTVDVIFGNRDRAGSIVDFIADAAR